MATRMELRGFDELRADLKALPADLQRESSPVLARYAERARAEIASAYPEITGALRASVRVVARQARGIASLFTLESAAPYAHIYEFGSARQPPRATFLPIQDRERRESVVAVADLVESHGLKVTGERD